jgi:predicted Zn finger-like uncharacterized protein
LIIQCPNCRSKYQYDEERFERKPSKKIKCAKCQTVFEIHNPAFAPREVKPVAVGDDTFSRRDETVSRFTRAEPLPEPESESAPKPNPALALPVGRRLSLAILDGDAAGTVFRIEKPRVTIGRAGADLVINDSEASRLHAAVEIRENNYTVLDLGSTNGTLVGGEKITEPVELHDKGEFQIGTTTLMFIVTEEM